MKQNHIFIICGKSNSGKDTILNSIKTIIEHESINLKILTTHTTRPKRENETNEYIFDDQNTHDGYYMDNKIMEERKYNVYGTSGNEVWTYYTITDDIKVGTNYISINTPDGIMSIINHLHDDNELKGKFKVHTLYIDCDDETLLTRAMNREKLSLKPNYKEMARRFVSDIEDFSDSVIRKLEVKSILSAYRYDSFIPITHRVFEYMMCCLVDDEINLQTN